MQITVRIYNKGQETGEWFNAYEQRFEAIVSNMRGVGWRFRDNLDDLHARLQWK
ncbi:hypothetical protein N0M98_13695 [Paenibacillus doosanensis]|nr:hypothetical protein [Paenibacillus doosanensis]